MALWGTPWQSWDWVESMVAQALTMSLPESEDTEDAEEPEESSWWLGRDRVSRGPEGDSGSRPCVFSASQELIRSLILILLSEGERPDCHSHTEQDTGTKGQLSCLSLSTPLDYFPTTTKHRNNFQLYIL